MLLPHLASRLYGTPLLLARTKLDIILAVLGSRIGWTEPQAALALPQARASPTANTLTGPGIAVIPVHGSLVRRSMAMDAQSGLTSYPDIASLLDAAVTDPGINGILLDIDSPGGEAGGVFDLARRVREIDAIKPVWALASDGAYSAAYAIASAASRVYVTQTGGVGSIGVIAMHVDQSARDAQEGYRFTAVTAGDLKNERTPISGEVALHANKGLFQIQRVDLQTAGAVFIHQYLVDRRWTKTSAGVCVLARAPIRADAGVGHVQMHGLLLVVGG